MDSNGQFDVTSLGSTMIRLSVPSGERLETASVYEVRTAGTESNTMVALARMGFRTGWVSRLGDNPLGRRIAREIGHHGVDTSSVIWTEDDRNELFFVEYGSSPRPIQVLYDRAHSAVSRIRQEEVDTDYLLRSSIVHLTGIFPALSDSCAAITEHVISAAKSAGVKVSFDVNYRGKLWSPVRAREVLTPLVSRADILIITREDADDVFDITGAPEEVAATCHKAFRVELAVLTLGAEGGIAFDGTEYYRCGGYDVDVVDRLGAGDCFAAGVLCGYLEGSLQTGMNYASAMAALKLGIRGDYFVSSRAEVETLMNSGGGREVGR